MLNRVAGKIRVLIVDDSSFMRMAIRAILSRDPDIEVVGTAVDGAEGVSCAIQLRPDIITMDVEMPRLDGIAAVRQIMAAAPTRVIMASSLTCEGASATFDALEAGAADYVPKSTSDSPRAQETFRNELLRKVKETARSAFRIVPGTVTATRQQPHTVRLNPRTGSRQFDYIAIGASTGGPIAVQEILTRLPASFACPVLVAIHMPKAFTGPYAERLNNKCPLRVKEADDGELIRSGTVLIAPGGVHTTVIRQAGGLAVKLAPPSDYPQNLYIPSVNLMLASLADTSNGSVLGVVLTGMGNDGMNGMQLLKSRGGTTVVQDEATSTIFGMPRACIEAGVADEVLPLEQIGPALVQLTMT